jgi:hypothetical protein
MERGKFGLISKHGGERADTSTYDFDDYFNLY